MEPRFFEEIPNLEIIQEGEIHVQEGDWIKAFELNLGSSRFFCFLCTCP